MKLVFLRSSVRGYFLLFQWFSMLAINRLILSFNIRLKRPKAQSGYFSDSNSEESFQDFLAANASIWKEIHIDKDLDKKDKSILIEAHIQHPGYILDNLVPGRHMMDTCGLPATGLLREQNKKQELLFKSYGINNFVYLNGTKKNIFDVIYYGLKAVNLIKCVKNIDEFVELKHGEICIGKLAYDDCLRRTGYGTLEKFSWYLFERLVSVLTYQDFFERLFSTRRFPVLIQAEKQFVPAGVLCQVALKYGTVIYSRGGGPSSFTLRRYDDIREVYTGTHKYSKELFSYIYDNYREKAARLGFEYINKRFKGESSLNDIADAAFAFKKGQPVILRQELCDRLSWDMRRPIIGIMTNMIADGVFAEGWRLFRDNLVWFKRTLQIAREVDNVNWFIKPHPSDKGDRKRANALYREYMKWGSGCKHIKFLPDDISSNSLPGIVNVILTVYGSAGIEYPCFGIPSILGGGSLYSGLGFTHEPETEEKYAELLKNIHMHQSLDNSQIEKARVFMYIYMILSRVNSNLIPNFSVFDDCDEAKLWAEAADLVRNYKTEEDRFKKMMHIQVKNKYRHLLNYDWIGWA